MKKIITRNNILKTGYETIGGKFILHSFEGKPSKVLVFNRFETKRLDLLWHKNGLLHNENGPAHIISASSSFKKEEYYLEGKKVKKHDIIMKKLKDLKL